ncbi:SPRY-domain-containing protein [Aspergillus novofumigatus IBT 16806]|uniref:SPRY-domain-containing protein n=1 Tax=Aspergillus novofumigatus (strain IBT 16806) TaxID=1392255 RepID=A0A2I1CLZ9_ASPN1|nr:SPRY-domain-containing protein [Aspergillus novofumigatus IBT 16806]PKX98642.1 SPRY-domain-containing protein [Aspergillus novofumigatus IBT 16806]
MRYYTGRSTLLRRTMTSLSSGKLKKSFFRFASKERETWLRRYRDMRPFERIPEGFSVFHVAARWGIASLVHFALSEISGCDDMQSTRDNDRDIRRYDDSEFVAANRVTPLEEAAREGRADIIHVLLKNALPAMVIRTEVVVAAAANQQSSKVLALLLNERGDQIKVTEAVVKGAAGNRENGEEVMELLLDQRGHQIGITEDVVKAAAGNQTKGKEVMDLLLDRRGVEVPVTEDVVKAAAENRGGKEVMELLLDQRGDQIHITEDVVKAAAGNQMKGREMMALLLDRRGHETQTTEDVAKVAAGNRGNGEEVMALLLDRQGDQIQVTKGVIKAAAGNGRKGKEVMALLLGHLGRQIQIEHHELQTASWKRNIEKVEQLLANGANAASANRCGWAPLHAASWNGDIQVARLLLAKGAHPTAKSNIGWTPLDAALANGRVDTVRLLLPHDPDAAANFTPTCFSDLRKSGVLELDGEKLEVRYVRLPNKGRAAPGPPVVFGSVLANKPISPLEDVFYFEIEVISSGHNGAIALGVCRENSVLERMPGWEETSWGYHGDDGKKFHSASQGQPYAEKFGDGDRIGCRLEMSSGKLEFFKNGRALGVAFTNVHGFVFPVVGIGSYGAQFGLISGRMQRAGADSPKYSEASCLRVYYCGLRGGLAGLARFRA